MRQKDVRLFVVSLISIVIAMIELHVAWDRDQAALTRQPTATILKVPAAHPPPAHANAHGRVAANIQAISSLLSVILVVLVTDYYNFIAASSNSRWDFHDSQTSSLYVLIGDAAIKL